MTIQGSVWTPIGPSPIDRANSTREDNGLTSAIAIHPNNPNIIYQGTAGGGVWRTQNGGTTWTPIFDRQLSLGIGSIAIDPNDTSVIYVGTSNRLALSPVGDTAAGLFKSTDGGASWIRLGSGYPANNTGDTLRQLDVDSDPATNNIRNINIIIVDPADSERVYMATSNGVFVSDDGGDNWGVLRPNSNGDVRTLVLDTSSPVGARILYAGITNRGVFQSTNSGQNWTPILNAATPVVAAAVGAGDFGKVLVALPPATQPPAAGGIQVLYVSLRGTGGAPDPVGLFRSTDQGASWIQRPAVGMPTKTQFDGYSFQMAVDPASPGDGSKDIIYLGCVRQARSSDSGANFPSLIPLTDLHADTQSWAFAPQPVGTPSIVFCGNDGGLFRSIDDGTTWTPLNGGGLQTTLFYNLAVKPDATASVTLGTAQDNGVQTTSGAVAPAWSARGGDGWDVEYDGVTPDRVYGTSGAFKDDPATPEVEPVTRAFRSDADGTDIPGPDNITPWLGQATELDFFLATVATDPSNAGVVYVAGNENLWQSRNAGDDWQIVGAFPTSSQRLTAKAFVAPANGDNVVVAVDNQVSVSTNALTANPADVTFDFNITRDLPTTRNVLRAAFDPNDPTVIYAVLGGFNTAGDRFGHVFRTTIAGTTWEDISPDLDIPFGALALDGTDTPTTIYVGTDLGVLRSVDGGATWYVLDDIHFPRAPVTDLVIGRGSGILRAATYGRGAFEFAAPNGPVISVNLATTLGENGFQFGEVCEGPVHLLLQIFNVGTADLVIHSVQRLMGSIAFTVEPFPGTPLVISPGDEVDFTIRYTPTAPGAVDVATIRIRSNDPGAPNLDLQVTGTGGVATAVIAIADDGDFGEVCLESFVDRDLVINNSGTCRLEISAITSSSPAFIVPDVVSFPLVVSGGGSINLPLRFQPIALGAAAATIRVFSNDPGSPAQIGVRGSAPAPELDLIVANTGNFGDVCIGSFVDQPLTLLNSGSCTLTVTNVASSAAEFIAPNVLAFPIRIAAGTAVQVPIRFEPASFGAKVGTITVTSDDPAGAKSVSVSGNVPSGKLVVTGSTCIGGVKACCLGERTISICNVGDCNLHVTSVAFKRKSKHWKLINNPFPATLHPGSCLSVLIRYKATEKCPRCCELVITSDDPDTPVKTLEVIAYTIWSDCGCKKCCDDCRKGCCEKRHDEYCSACCSAQSLDPCCFDEDDDHEDENES